MGAVSPKDVDKVRKLLRLTNSPNPHEAARAKEQAERFMRRRGLTYADVEEDAVVPVEIGDDRRDANLARIVGISRRCSALLNKRGQLAFKGRRERAVRARDLYLNLSAEVAQHCNLGDGAPGRFVWRRYYWGGFIHAVTERMRDAELLVWTPPPSTSLEHGSQHRVVDGEIAATRDTAADELRQFADRFLPEDQHAVKRFCEEAFEAGKRLGRNVSIPRDEPVQDPTRALPEWDELEDDE